VVLLHNILCYTPAIIGGLSQSQTTCRGRTGRAPRDLTAVILMDAVTAVVVVAGLLKSRLPCNLQRRSS
jgi:hypothetical protein